MNANPKKKMCWNCEGNMAVEDDVCPYCNTSLDPDKLATDGNSLYPPLYSIGSAQTKLEPFPRENKIDFEDHSDDTEEEDVEPITLKDTTLTLALLSGGSILLLFSLTLFLFSTHGYLTLRWNSDYKFFYLAAAIPMLIFGMRSLKRFEE